MNGIAGILEPLALGLSTGTWCAMYCAPVLLPFLFGREGLTQRKNISLVGIFLGGRLIAYASLGFVLFFSGFLVMEFFDPALSRRISYAAYLFCGAVLLANALAPGLLSRIGPKCGAGCGSARAKKAALLFAGNDGATAFLSGLGVGLHICPPFWAAAFRAANAPSAVSGAAYFLLFYAGTMPFFLPILGVPSIAKRVPGFRRVARMTQALMGAYLFAFAGFIPFFFRR